VFFEAPGGDALILFEAGELRPSARLRKVFEQSKVAAALPCFADDARTIDALVSSELSGHGLEITAAARERLLSLLGADRQLTRNELEKLCLYMHGRETVEEEDVEAICGDAAASTIDEVVDAAVEGDVDRVDRAFARLQAAGIGITPVVLALGRHLIRLQALLASGGGGRNVDQTVRSARPPFPFGRVPSVKRQLAIWSEADLRRMIAAVSGLEGDTRTEADLAPTLLGRTLVGMAHNARSIRLRRN
jgi:DNA polymerase-3 subunit delta